MEQVSNLNPYVLTGLALAAVVAGLTILAALRSERPKRAALVTRSLRCPQRQESAVVTFIDRPRGASMMRSVESCSLLDVGERCSEACIRCLDVQATGEQLFAFRGAIG